MGVLPEPVQFLNFRIGHTGEFRSKLMAKPMTPSASWRGRV